MLNFTTVIGFTEGLHARPASQLVKVCQTAKSDIKIIKGTTTVNPKSILGILSLGAGHMDNITVEVSGEDEAVIIQNLKDFFANTED